MNTCEWRCLLVLTGGIFWSGCVPQKTDQEQHPVAEKRLTRGIEVLLEENFAGLHGKRVGLVTNQTGVDRTFRHLADLLEAMPEVTLVALFGPEHGVRGSAQAGDKVGDGIDGATGVPIYSLYGKRKKPTSEQLEGIDVLLYDIQDVGVRTYTYLSTLVLVLEAAAAEGIEVVVLDRPNPLGGDIIEGPLLEQEFESFIGPHPIPLRYGMTVGEFASMVNTERGIAARLNILPLQGWRRDVLPARSSTMWIAPSPNIPTPLSALLYAGVVLIEGTNLSEGRGTTRPFQLVGAPWLDARAVADHLNASDLPGVAFRPTGFVPTFSKYQGEACEGIEIHVLDRRACRPVWITVSVIVAVRQLQPDRFRFIAGAFDRLAGTARLREAIERGDSPATIVTSWEHDLDAFRSRRQGFLRY